MGIGKTERTYEVQLQAKLPAGRFSVLANWGQSATLYTIKRDFSLPLALKIESPSTWPGRILLWY